MIVGVRHAPVDPVMAGRCYGQTDVGVALPHGEAAVQVAAALAAQGHRFDRVWSSDLERCRGLAEALVPLLDGDPTWTVDVRLRELDHGQFEGRAWEEIHVSDAEALARWGVVWKTEGPPGGESADQLGERVAEWLHDLVPGERHLLVGHAGVLRALRVVAGPADCTANWADAMGEPVPFLVPHTFA